MTFQTAPSRKRTICQATSSSTPISSLQERIEACADMSILSYPKTVFFAVPKLLKSFKEWWFQSKKQVVQKLESRKTDVDSDECDSDYHCDSDNENNQSHSSVYPAFGKKTYCGVEIIGPDHFGNNLPAVEHDSDAFCDLTQMFSTFGDNYSAKF